MSQLYYMALADGVRWTKVLTDVGAQLAPYRHYLANARDAEEKRVAVLAWRSPTAAEVSVLEERVERIYQQKLRRAKSAQRRRDRQEPVRLSGMWVMLQAPPWQPEMSDKVFDEFFEARLVCEIANVHAKNVREHLVSRLHTDREARALLLSRLPGIVEPKAEGDGDHVSPYFGRLLFLKPDTTGLRRQLDAVYSLENAPTRRVAPLAGLAIADKTWPDVLPVSLADDQWEFLRRGKDGRLRDGTEQQRHFVNVALGTPDFAVLEGPPGSGKTTVICELVSQLARAGQRVLLVASTHVAVDNVLERIQDALDDGRAQEVFAVRVGDEDRVAEKVQPLCLPRLRKTVRADLRDFLDNAKGDLPGAAARKVIAEAIATKDDGFALVDRLVLDSANLVCGTTIGILKHPLLRYVETPDPALPKMRPFDVLILDEASKTTFTEFLTPARFAARWIVVGDVRQLSPYVEEAELADNFTRLVPPELASAAVAAFAGTPGRRRISARRLVVPVDDPIQRAMYVRECEARNAVVLDVNAVPAIRLPRGGMGWPLLLAADVVVGSRDILANLVDRLPSTFSSPVEDAEGLDAWEARCRSRDRRFDLRPQDPLVWANEMAWRQVRSHELRQDRGADRDLINGEIDALLPQSLSPEQSDKLRRALDNVRRVALPSVLEILQRGTNPLPGWTQRTALTHGLPKRALQQRLVSLAYQHRMAPEISAFPRQRFYSTTLPEILDEPATERQTLLLDSRSVIESTAWPFQLFDHRAVWLDVAPDGKAKRDRKNANSAEVAAVLDVLRRFRDVAGKRPRPDGQPWEVAVLTFYRAQETAIREQLQRESGQFGNSRNFSLPSNSPTLHVTLCTVDRFQGHEADLEILSFVKSGSVGFLNSPNRLLVALTRPRHQLVLVGHRTWFAGPRHESELLRDLATTPCYPQAGIHWKSTKDSK